MRLGGGVGRGGRSFSVLLGPAMRVLVVKLSHELHQFDLGDLDVGPLAPTELKLWRVGMGDAGVFQISLTDKLVSHHLLHVTKVVMLLPWIDSELL